MVFKVSKVTSKQRLEFVCQSFKVSHHDRQRWPPKMDEMEQPTQRT